MAKITEASTDKHLGQMVKRSEIHLKEYEGFFIALMVIPSSSPISWTFPGPIPLLLGFLFKLKAKTPKI